MIGEKNKSILISEAAGPTLADYLKQSGYAVNLVKKNSCVSGPVSSHPDIFFCALPNGLYRGDPALLGHEYPEDVLYNAAWVGKYFICSKHTSSDLLDCAKQCDLIPVCVPQGYVKCNILIVDDLHVITEDEGIEKILKRDTDIDCLIVLKGGVSLPGYRYGFIGGAGGRVGDEIIFNGNLSAHRDHETIKNYIRKCGLGIKEFFDYDLTDIGSIICYDKYI